MNPHSSSSSFEKGIVWMLLSAACLSFSILFLKINLSYLNYYFLVFLRFFIPFLFILILFSIRWEWKVLIFSTHIPLQLFRCACVLVSQYGIVFYLTKNTLLNATVLLNTAPLFIPIIEWIFLGHRPGKSTILGALLAFLGVILILHPNRSLFTPISGIGLLAAIGQAGSQVLYGLKPKSENPLASLFYLFLFSSLFSGVLFFLIEGKEKIEWSQNYDWIIFTSLILMALGTLLNQYFRGLAYRCGRPSTLVTFLYFSVFVSAFLDWVVFKHTPSLLTVIGSVLIVLGGVLKVFLRAKILKSKK